jgi:amino acid permease
MEEMPARKSIGYLAIALPFVVYLGAWIVFQTGMQGSISDYYYTGMRDVFVGTLWAIGVFLFAYKGYGRADSIASKLAGVFAVGITLFPTAPAPRGVVHFAFATLFFATLIYYSYFLFTKTNAEPGQPPTISRTKQRNRVYKRCAVIMLICIGLAALYSLVPSLQASLPSDSYHPIFWLEALADVAFGISWAIKGEALSLLNDKA